MYTYVYDERITFIVLVILLIICIASALINAFLLFGILQMPEMKSQFGNQLIALVALGDFLGAISTTACLISWFVLGYPGILESKWYCSTFGVLVYLFHNMSGITLSILAFEKYLVICFRFNLPVRMTYIVLILTGLVFGILLIGNSISNSFTLDPTHIFCLPFGSEWAKAARKTFNILVNLPLLVLTFSNICIFLKCKTYNSSTDKNQITKKVARRTLVFVFVYFVCYIPKFATSIISTINNDVNSPPLILYILAPITLSLIMTMNPILTLFLHNRIKEKVQLILFPNNNKKNQDPFNLDQSSSCESV